jgi:nucleotide-binding universal stress UspA family protein
LLLRRCEELEARMLVMGAYGHRGWRDFLFGSTTSHLLESASLPLFIHH